jgi:alpha-L-arabinofuranosidase
MKKDIDFEAVTDVAVSVVYDDEQNGWYVYLINLKKEYIENVFVTSTGYKQEENKAAQKTSTFRQYLGDIAPRNHYARVI